MKFNQREEGCRQMLGLCTQLHDKDRRSKKLRISHRRKQRDVGFHKEVKKRGDKQTVGETSTGKRIERGGGHL